MAYDHPGKIKFYNAVKRFGFVTLDGGDEAFFYIGVCSRNVIPKIGDRVRCDIDPKADKGPKVTALVFE